MCCAYVWTGAMHIVHGVTRTEINLSSKKTFSQLQTGQGYLKYRSNLKNILPTPYIFLRGGGGGAIKGGGLESRCEGEPKMGKINTRSWLLDFDFYFYNILSYLKKIHAASKIFFTQPCLSSHVNLRCHKNSVDFNSNSRHVKVARAGKQHFAPVFHLWTKVLQELYPQGIF